MDMILIPYLGPDGDGSNWPENFDQLQKFGIYGGKFTRHADKYKIDGSFPVRVIPSTGIEISLKTTFFLRRCES